MSAYHAFKIRGTEDRCVKVSLDELIAAASDELGMSPDRLREIAEAEREGCQYVQEDEDSDTWTCSNCDYSFVLNDGNPFDNGFEYCPKCGRPIKSINVDTWDWEIESENKHVEKIIMRQEYVAAFAEKGAETE